MPMPLTDRNLSICVSCTDCTTGRGCRYVRKGINYKPRKSSNIRKPQLHPIYTKKGVKRQIIKIINGEPHRRCAICKKYLPYVNFHKNSKIYGGLISYCKNCRREYLKKVKRPPRDQSAYWKDYYERNKDKINHRHIAEKDKSGAHRVVKKALLNGTLKIADKCENCPEKDKKLMVPHHDSYLKENWLKVRWLCRSCHRQHHKDLEQVNINRTHPSGG